MSKKWNPAEFSATNKVEPAKSTPRDWGYRGVPNKGGATHNSRIADSSPADKKN